MVSDIPDDLRDASDHEPDITWDVDPSPRPAQRAKLLELLFGEPAAA